MPDTATQNFTLVVNAPPPPPLTITNATSPLPAQVGVPYSFQFTASGGVPPYSWSLLSSIPGLTLDATSGVLSGTPTTAGSYSDVATVTDSAP